MRAFVLFLTALTLMMNGFSAASNADTHVIGAANAQGLRLRVTLTPTDGDVPGWVFNSTGTMLYAGGGSTPLAAWDVGAVSSSTALSFKLEPSSYYGFALSADDRLLAINIGTDLGGLALYDAQTGEQVAVVPCSGGDLAIAFSPTDSTLLAAYAPAPGGPPSQIDFWRVMPIQPGQVSVGGAASPAECSANASVAVDPVGGSLREQLIFAPDGQTLLYGMQMIDVSTLAVTRRLYTGGLRTAAFSPDSMRLAAVTEDDPETVAILDSADGNAIATVPVNADGLIQYLMIRSVGFSPNGELLAVYGDGYADGEAERFVGLWDTMTYAPVVWLKTAYNGDGSLDNLPRQLFSPDGKWLALSNEAAVYLYGVG